MDFVVSVIKDRACTNWGQRESYLEYFSKVTKISL